MRSMNNTTKTRIGALGTLALGTALLAGCEVTNPGPIQDEFLGEPEAQPGLIFGAQRAIAETYGARMLDLGYMARDIFPGRQTGAWGTNVNMHAGHPEPGDGPGFTALHQ